jgi:hypothetical protein
MAMSIFEEWERGDVPDTLALRSLLSALGETESEIKLLTAEKEERRKQIDRVVSRMGGRAEIAGLAVASIVGGGERVSYDASMLDALAGALARGGVVNEDTGEVQEMSADEMVKLALTTLRAARKATSVRASLRVDFEKGRK